MTVMITDACATRLLAGTTFPAQFNGGAVQLYEGSLPVSAELPPGGILLGTLKDELGNPPQFVQDGTSIILDPAHTYRFELVATGTPSFLRFAPNVSNSGSTILTDQHNLPLVTTTAQVIDLNTFYVTLT